ncbi:hypothetical protein [Aestuariivivens sediminicola]|uniref:hypothetical protein n=1 Tax=Aestuariivivens sediminicola TaxID=2913560 RepID=UPI001F5A8D9A|nr:hypothetical protein [Aestuariivivens sediminicola]
MTDVCDILGLKDSRSAKKWLHDNNVAISIIGGRSAVCQFTFELKRQQLLVEELRLSYPNKWFEIYEANTPNKGMVKAIRELYPESKLIKKGNKKYNNYKYIK